MDRVRALGVHAASDVLWFAAAEPDGTLIDLGNAYRLDLPKGLDTGQALIVARKDICRVLRAYDIGLVWLLSAEYDKRFKQGYHALVPRITMETVVAFAAAEEDVEFRRVARETVRSRLGYDSGKLQDIAVDLVPEKITPNWGPNKRDLAVATVLAALSELEDSQ